MKTPPVPEQALYLTPATRPDADASGYSRIYYGHEFCERLLPTPAELKAALASAGPMGAAFTFVTPYVTERGLGRVRDLLVVFAAHHPDGEVVFNDWGVLRLLNREFATLTPVMGRLMTKMKRGPRLADLVDRFNAATADYFRTCSLDVPIYREFLLQERVARVELDNVLQGIDLCLDGTGLYASIYVPFGYIATTRLCLAAACDTHGMEDEVGVLPCKQECRDYTFEVQPHGAASVQLRKGNTVFFENTRLPDNLGRNGIDRVVVEPTLPF